MSTTPPSGADGPPSGRFAGFSFTIDEEVRGLGVHGAFFIMSGLTNLAGHDEYDELLGAALDDLDGGYDLKTDPVLKGYRALHTAIGRSNRDHVASAENLHRLVKMNGTIPRANLLIDIHNLVSLKTRLAISAHDLESVNGDVRLSLSTGRERFYPDDAAPARPLHPGEYAYVDSAGEVIWRLETRQAARTRPTLATSDCFYVVQGNPATSAAYVRRAARNLARLVRYFCGGSQRTL
jgi:DNA/RNA-binding domain of Phe-tRNA-synthetase-like protein